MGLKIPAEAFAQFLDDAGERYANAIKTALMVLGNDAQNMARNRSAEASWFDRTGNLRSSIGAAVYDHGVEFIRMGLGVVGNGSQGAANGAATIQELAKKYAEVYALVVVAGMEYAEYVEAMNNKDVLASTEIWVRSKIDKVIQDAVDEVTRQINQETIR